MPSRDPKNRAPSTKLRSRRPDAPALKGGDLISTLSGQASVPRKQVKAVMDALAELLQTAAENNIPVDLPGIGMFMIRVRRGASIPNPQPGKSGSIYRQPACFPLLSFNKKMRRAAQKYDPELKLAEQIAEGTTKP